MCSAEGSLAPPRLHRTCQWSRTAFLALLWLAYLRYLIKILTSKINKLTNCSNGWSISNIAHRSPCTVAMMISIVPAFRILYSMHNSYREILTEWEKSCSHGCNFPPQKPNPNAIDKRYQWTLTTSSITFLIRMRRSRGCRQPLMIKYWRMILKIVCNRLIRKFGRVMIIIKRLWIQI